VTEDPARPGFAVALDAGFPLGTTRGAPIGLLNPLSGGVNDVASTAFRRRPPRLREGSGAGRLVPSAVGVSASLEPVVPTAFEMEDRRPVFG